MKITTIVPLAGITLLLGANVYADSIRCGSQVIEDEQLHDFVTMEEVIEKCGQPSSREGSTIYYKEKGKQLHFNPEGHLVSIDDIEDDET